MGVDGEEADHLLVPRLDAPHPRPGDEHPLQPGEPVDHRCLGEPGLPERDAVGLERDRQAAEVADVLPDRQRPVDVVLLAQLRGRERLVLRDQGGRPPLELRPVLGRPPVREPPVAVVLAALVVEAVPDLVADDGADPAVVPGVVGVGVEEGRLEDGGREDDLVQAGVVVRVHGLRRHEPLLAVHRAAEFRQFVVEFERRGGPDVAEEVVRGERQAGVVAPLRGVPDLRREGRQLREGPLARGLTHPVERRDGLAIGLHQVGHQALHRRLVLRWEVPRDVDLADRLAQHALHERDAALPAVAQFLGPGEGAAVEREVLLDDRRGQVRRARVDHAPRQPVAPGLLVLLRPGAGEGLRVGGLPDDQAVERPGRRSERRHPGGPVEPWRRFRERRQGHRVVRLGGVAVAHPVPVAGGQRGLQGHDARRGRPGGVIVVRAGEGEHRGDVRHVRLPDRGVRLLAVVGLVRQAQAGLVQVDRVPVGGVGVVVHPERHAAAHAAALERAHRPGAAGDVDRAGDDGEVRRQGRRAEGVDRLGGHERGVERPDQLGLVGVAGVGGDVPPGAVLDDVPDVLLGLVVQRAEGSVARTVGRDLMRGEPRPVDVAEEVVLGPDGGVRAGEERGRRHAPNLRHGPNLRRRPSPRRARYGPTTARTGREPCSGGRPCGRMAPCASTSPRTTLGSS